MTPKEKANDIYNRMTVDYKMDKWQTKMCSLVAVDEILKNGLFTFEDKKYWEEVKHEIEDI